VNHVRLPKEVILPDSARKDKQGKQGDHVDTLYVKLFISTQTKFW